MNERGQKSTWSVAKTHWSRLCLRTCAAALTIALCCIAIPVWALADENAPDTPEISEEAPSSDSSESADPNADDDSEADSQQNADNESGASENSSDNADANVSPDADISADEASGDDVAPDSTPSTQAPSEEANQPDDAINDDYSGEMSEGSPKSNAMESADEEESDRDGTIKGEQKTPEEEAADKLEQASAIYDHMNRLADEIAIFQTRYDELMDAENKVLSDRGKTRRALKQEQEHLNELKEEMSNHIVKMYKQEGVLPYLDVLCNTASFKEFLSLWHMLDKVAHYGEREFREQIKVVKSLEAEVIKASDRIDNAEKEVDEARAKLNRSRLTYLSLAPHAASLRIEAAEMLGDAAGLASAQSDYDSSYAELRNALDQGLAEAGRLEGEGIFTNPCPDAEYSSGFGYRTFDNAYHLGLDMAIGEGTPYYAADDGVVIDATNGGGYNGGAGNWIVISHGNGVVTKYMHSSVTFVVPGDTVMRGQNIGLVGNTGNSSGPHLHFQIEIDGVAVDPLIYL